MIEWLSSAKGLALLGAVTGMLGGWLGAFWKVSSASFLETVKQNFALELQKERSVMQEQIEVLRTDLRVTEGYVQREYEVRIEVLMSAFDAISNSLVALRVDRSDDIAEERRAMLAAIETLEGYSSVKSYLVPREIAQQCGGLAAIYDSEWTDESYAERAHTLSIDLEETMRIVMWGRDDLSAKPPSRAPIISTDVDASRRAS